MNDDIIIDWSKDYLLKWSDFQGDFDRRSLHDSESSIKYWAVFTIDPNDKDTPTKFSFTKIELVPQFQKKFSWVKEQEISKRLLKHEQGHFDLAEELRSQITKKVESELRGRWFPLRGNNEKQMIQNAKNDAESLMMERVEKWKEQIFVKQGAFYDEETKHGTVSDKQDEYDKRFAKLR